MNRFRVWIRTVGQASRVGVDGIANTQWLLDCLGRSFVFKTSEPVQQDLNSAWCTFQVMYSPQMPRRGLEKLLASIPRVSLVADPA